MTYREINGVISWFEAFHITDIREVVLKYPRIKNIRTWEILLEKTFREFDQSFLKRDIRRRNKALNLDYTRRIVMLGGDSENGVAYHAHCLVDGLGSDKDFFVCSIKRAWINNIRKYLRINGKRKFHEKEADVYCSEYKDATKNYLIYATRFEGNDFASRLDKICWNASSNGIAKTTNRFFE